MQAKAMRSYVKSRQVIAQKKALFESIMDSMMQIQSQMCTRLPQRSYLLITSPLRQCR